MPKRRKTVKESFKAKLDNVFGVAEGVVTRGPTLGAAKSGSKGSAEPKYSSETPKVKRVKKKKNKQIEKDVLNSG